MPSNVRRPDGSQVQKVEREESRISCGTGCPIFDKHTGCCRTRSGQDRNTGAAGVRSAANPFMCTSLSDSGHQFQKRCAVADVLRSLEHHVFEKMRESGTTCAFVRGANVIPDVQCNDRKAVVFAEKTESSDERSDVSAT
jgi:hypothetical protein